jgi:hypothetical protein
MSLGGILGHEILVIGASDAQDDELSNILGFF